MVAQTVTQTVKQAFKKPAIAVLSRFSTLRSSATGAARASKPNDARTKNKAATRVDCCILVGAKGGEGKRRRAGGCKRRRLTLSRG